MKFLEFTEEVVRLADKPMTAQRDPVVTVLVHRPGSLGSTSSVAVKAIFTGIDWDSGQVMIQTEEQLTALTPEQVAAVEKSVRQGQSWHTYEAHKKHRAEVDALAAQRDELLAALEEVTKELDDTAWSSYVGPMLDRANAAITKAKGGAR